MHVSRPEARLAGTNQHIVLKEHIFEPGRIATSDDDVCSAQSFLLIGSS